MDEVLNDWYYEMEELKAKLYELGDKGDSFQYNILAAEALRLTICICDLQRKMLLTSNTK